MALQDENGCARNKMLWIWLANFTIETISIQSWWLLLLLFFTLFNFGMLFVIVGSFVAFVIDFTWSRLIRAIFGRRWLDFDCRQLIQISLWMNCLV